MLIDNPLPTPKHEGYPEALPIIRRFDPDKDDADGKAYAQEVAADALVNLAVISTAAFIMSNESDASKGAKREASLFVSLLATLNMAAIKDFLNTPTGHSVGDATDEERFAARADIIETLTRLTK